MVKKISEKRTTEKRVVKGVVKRSVTRRRQITKRILPIIIGLLLGALFVLAFFRLYRRTSTIMNQVIAENVENLTKTFKRIDETCGIIGFEHEKNYVDFLTVVKFVGSEIGAMNLRFSKGWEGAYVGDNPTVQEKQFVIFATDKGYYLAPDDGVVLSDGRVIGKDIVLDKNTDFESLINDGTLSYGGKALASRIK